uniref:WGS project CAEQ00000000 data, annotated contig 2020 n=1 Tax=Trypanosoma congolense (strain IL3000) TaxID=1068625 RepID=F9WAV2_TRYCI|nr:unnamed protein product [Trypanosoma congolense IL3000]
MCRCGRYGPYIFFLVQSLFMIGLVLFVFFPPKAVEEPMCNCNYGVVHKEIPQCQCVCFGDYLLPNCLYTAVDVVEMELWLVSKVDNGQQETHQLLGKDIEAGIDRLFGNNKDSGLFRFRRALTSGITTYDANNTFRQPVYVSALFTMPGWAAQHLLAYVKLNDGRGGGIRNSLSGTEYDLYAVYDASNGPPLPVKYYSESMALFTHIDSNVFIRAADWGWMFGALVLLLLLTRIEELWMYSIITDLGRKSSAPLRVVANPFVRNDDRNKESAASREETSNDFLLARNFGIRPPANTVSSPQVDANDQRRKGYPY